MYYFQFSVITSSSMEHRVQFTRVFLVTMMTILCDTGNVCTESVNYRKLDPVEDIAGVVIAEQKAVSSIECSGM